MRFLSCSILAACFALGQSASAQSAPTPSTSLHTLEQHGLDHFFNLEYDQAIAAFQRLRDAEPNDPAWQNHLAAAYIYKQLLIAGLLQGDLFTTTNGVFRTQKIVPDPVLDRGFRDANRAAIRLCEEALKRNSKDEAALYACGVAYAAKSTYHAIIERAKIDALSSARKAAGYHSELIRLDPNFYDAYLVTGIYDYALGSLPHSLRILLMLGGFSGDKERGIRAVETVTERGNRAKQDARIFLAVLYRREHRFADAQRVLRELTQTYPRNYIFPLEIASVHRRAGEDKDAIAVYEQMLDFVSQGRPGYANAPTARIHYELADLYWKAGEADSARSHLEQVAQSLGYTPDLEKRCSEMRRQMEAAMPRPIRQDVPSGVVAAPSGVS